MGASAEPNFGTTVSSKNFLRNTCEMFVVCEKQHLRGSRQICEHVKAGSRPVIVEVDEQVVGEKRKSHARLDRLLKRRDPQRKEELISRAFAHLADFDNRLAVLT